MEEIIERLAGAERDIASLRQWQEKQNGVLTRIEEKLDRFTWWLVLTLGGVVTSLILLIVNLLAR